MARVNGRHTQSVLLATLFAAVLSVVQVGCVSWAAGGRDAPKRTSSRAERSADEGDRSSPSVFERPLARASIEFKVHRYSAPQGSFNRGASNVWKLVNGPLADAAATLRLADNGFRAAIGRESDRQSLRELLGRVPELRSVLDRTHPDASRRVELDVGLCCPREVVFYHGRGGRLRGMDFVDARAKLMLAFELRSVNLREVWLEIVPAIEEPPGPPQWEIGEDGARQVPVKRRRLFEDLGFTAMIPKGGFLLLGASEGLGDDPLLGKLFFRGPSEKSVKTPADVRESIFVISPVVRFSRQGEVGRENRE